MRITLTSDFSIKKKKKNSFKFAETSNTYVSIYDEVDLTLGLDFLYN